MKTDECKECGGDPVIAEIARKMGHRPDMAYARVMKLEDMLFKLGAMEQAPCFCCGYNGPGYFQPDTHKCAQRHHKLYKT